ncbi:MAG: hypothetical protein LBT83_11475 [Tannerella sp.]|nr:hypothetical protein [Tannerella sp.]
MFPDSPATGKEIETNRTLYTVSGVIDNTKRFDYERPQNVYCVPMHLDSTNGRRSFLNAPSLSIV